MVAGASCTCACTTGCITMHTACIYSCMQYACMSWWLRSNTTKYTEVIVANIRAFSAWTDYSSFKILSRCAYPPTHSHTLTHTHTHMHTHMPAHTISQTDYCMPLGLCPSRHNCKVALATLRIQSWRDFKMRKLVAVHTCTTVDLTSPRLSTPYQFHEPGTVYGRYVCAGRPVGSLESAVMLGEFQNGV